VKLGVKVAHVEAGLRSRDRTMPEEINRLLTDQIADLLFTPSPDADENLIAEGIPRERIRFVGNVMIDSLQKNLSIARALPTREQLGLQGVDYGLLTLHRPSNVDLRDAFERILSALEVISAKLPIVFPVHPRTRKTIAELGLSDRVESMKDLRKVEPLGYLDFLNLSSGARLVLTDSGGIQEETTYLGIPCLTLRENTERPITVEMGTNVVVGTNATKIIAAANAALDGSAKKAVRQPPLWDGQTSERILDALEEYAAPNSV
jgi:UDP-N-acetylglucosamine 2-epimerase (non-hydrolysing)